MQSYRKLEWTTVIGKRLLSYIRHKPAQLCYRFFCLISSVSYLYAVFKLRKEPYLLRQGVLRSSLERLPPPPHASQRWCGSPTAYGIQFLFFPVAESRPCCSGREELTHRITWYKLFCECSVFRAIITATTSSACSISKVCVGKSIRRIQSY